MREYKIKVENIFVPDSIVDRLENDVRREIAKLLKKKESWGGFIDERGKPFVYTHDFMKWDGPALPLKDVLDGMLDGIGKDEWDRLAEMLEGYARKIRRRMKE